MLCCFNKPDISILSEEFLLELKGMKHKNMALGVLNWKTPSGNTITKF
ncbi:hypothetical protein METHB2_100057 [Candidatus Methylobacter favarea]|uniref:Type I restriction enzyme HindI endonuclease subunit-like C-terminal domain-containing protein n=1 Tax=Candidatus Methylobacter favarea TaxID=2707345 RepID=A0A8S0Y8X3_9GAMM|nr:hypothetical protein METHB2_100057 [Candidatus Methylobacter favarea]